MSDSDLFILARVLHIVAIVLWIGGVAFVTTILIPAINNISAPRQRYELFERLENQFSKQAKIVTLLAGASGFYLIHALNAWERFLHIQFWWMHAMIVIWSVFSLILFVLEPIWLHKWFKAQAIKNSEQTFKMLFLMHKVLLTASLMTIVGAVAGSHGYAF